MWKRNTEPTIPSLRAICSSFGITLSEFFAENDLVELTPDQKEFFHRWAALTPEQKELLMHLVSHMKK